MREGWEYKKLGEVCELTMGQSPESESYNKERNGMPFFQGCSDFGIVNPIVSTYCTAPKKVAEPMDVLISVRAPIGTLNIAAIQCCIGRGLASVRRKVDITDSKFLFYFLSHSKTELQRQGTGATFKSIGKDNLVNLQINLPPLTTQQQIVAELDLLSHILDQKRQQLKEYDALAESIFYDMFSDPVENPKGWEVSTIGDLFDVKGGKRIPKGMDYSEEKTMHPYLRASDMKNNTILDDDIHYISDEVYQKIKRYTVQKNDVYLTNVGVNLGMAGVIPAKYDGANLTENAVKFNNKGKNSVNPEYLCRYLNSREVQSYIDSRKMIVGVPKLAIFRIESIPLCLPPLSLQQSFASKIEAIEKQKQMLKESIKETETLFQSRMDYWFNA